MTIRQDRRIGRYEGRARRAKAMDGLSQSTKENAHSPGNFGWMHQKALKVLPVSIYFL
jgi:hypothetical protein